MKDYKDRPDFYDINHDSNKYYWGLAVLSLVLFSVLMIGSLEAFAVIETIN